MGLVDALISPDSDHSPGQLRNAHGLEWGCFYWMGMKCLRDLPSVSPIFFFALLEDAADDVEGAALCRDLAVAHLGAPSLRAQDECLVRLTVVGKPANNVTNKLFFVSILHPKKSMGHLKVKNKT